MVSVSCLWHTVLILISLMHGSKSGDDTMYLCATKIKLVKRVEWGYNEFRIWPGVENSNGECTYQSDEYAFRSLKKGWERSICQCKEVKKDDDLCVYVAEEDNSKLPHCGEKSFSLSKNTATTIKGIAVKKKCGDGNKDGEVDVTMVLKDSCNCNGCSSSSSDDSKGGNGGGGYSGGGGGGSGGNYRFEQYQAMENDEEVDNYSMLQSESDKTPQNRTIYITIGASAGLFILCMALTVFRCIRRKGGNKYETSNTQNDEESDNEVVENVELEMMNNEMDTIEERIKEKVTAS